MVKKKAKTKKNKIKGLKKLTNGFKKLVKTHGAELVITLATGIITEIIAEKTKKFIKDKATKKENEPAPAEAPATLADIKKQSTKKSPLLKEVPQSGPARKNTPRKSAVNFPVV